MPPSRIKETLLIILIIIPIIYIVKSAYIWNEISTCLQRILFTNCCYILYLRFADINNTSFAFDFFQITLILWIVQDYNENDNSCLDSGESYFLYLSDIFNQFLLWAYTLSSIFLISFAVIAITYLRPERSRERRLSENEFDEVPMIYYTEGISENTLCSICLNDFNQNEKVLQLPGCNHLFHRECIRLWLNTHLDCPYCRSNVREQLQIIKREPIIESNHNNNNNDSQIHIQLDESNDSNIYINSQLQNSLHL